MRNMEKELVKRKGELEKTIQKIDKALMDPPQGKLRLSSKDGKPQYYIRSSPSERIGRYLRKDQLPQAAAIAQRDYNTLARKAALEEREAIGTLLRIYEEETIVEDVYGGLSAPRRVLVRPVAVSDEEYARLWLAQPYQPKGFAEGAPEYYSAKGLRVRSKSEALIADMYDSLGIPMKYEFPLELWNGRIVYTDFRLLNVAERKVFIHEHLGMADDPDYMRQAVRRLRDLQLSGFTLGVNLIITVETKDTPLDVRMVREQVRQMGLCPLYT